MHKVRLFLFSLVCFTFFGNAIIAQQDSIANNSIRLQIDNLNFLKDNEYANNIADGYTLIGSQLHPKVAFYPYPKAKLEFGLFGLTYAGLEKYHKVIPTFTFSYKTKKSVFNMGSYYDDTNHKLIAPLMTEESNLDERSIENGLQYIYKTTGFEIDTWLNWETFIFKNDTKNEEFILGLSAQYTPIENSNWKLDFSLQNLFYHRGGQINIDLYDSRNSFTMRQSALGFNLSRTLANDRKIALSSHFLQHQTDEKPEEFFYESGYGSLTSLNYSFCNWTIGTGFWYGNEFAGPRGDPMFQSVSTKVDYNYVEGEVYEVYANHKEPTRSLFLGTVNYKRELLPNIIFNLKTNFFFQNYYSKAELIESVREVENQLDFSFNLGFSYYGNFKLK